MPIDDGKPQMVAHRFSLNDFFRIIMLKGERIPGTGAFKGNFGDWKVRIFHEILVQRWFNFLSKP
jgi:hypothetical protein